MRTVRNYYEILGLGRDASTSQIKRRYKQLVSKYHPDVAADKATAHRLFIQINEAYEVLSDPTRRRAYDEGLEMTARRSQPPSPPPGGVPKLIKEAQWAFIQRKFTVAASCCKDALRIDGRCSTAYAILGDVYRAQGKISTAVKYYSAALQYNPADRETEKKMTTLVGKRMTSARRTVRSVDDPWRRAAISVFSWTFVFLPIMLISAYPGDAIQWLQVYIPQVSKWSWNLVGLMAAGSAVAGMLLSVNGLVSHPDDELVFDNSGNGWAVIPTGLILLLVSGVFFPGAAAFYILVSLMQGNLSRSVLLVFGCVIVIVLLSALMYPVGTEQVILYGGNVSFFACLIGWYFGSLLKPLAA